MWVLAPTQDRISELSLRSGCCCCVLPPACAGELVAVKAVDATRFHSISEIEQVQEEMAVLAQLRHPNIIRLQEVVFAGGCFYFMMEYASGGSLAGHLAAQPGGRLGEAAAREVFGGILAALEYCHKRCAARVVLRVVQCAWLLKPLLLLCAGVLRQTVGGKGCWAWGVALWVVAVRGQSRCMFRHMRLPCACGAASGDAEVLAEHLRS